MITDRAPASANVIEDLLPTAWHNTGQYENNRVECDHGRLKARLRPLRGLKPNERRAWYPRPRLHPEPTPRHYDLAVETAPLFRLATAFVELSPAI